MIKWVINNPNGSVALVFAILGIVALVFQNSGGGGEGSGGGGEEGDSKNWQGKSGIEGAKGDSLRFRGAPVQATLYDNGDTSSISYYNSEGKRTKYIEKYENGDTVRLYTTQYIDSTRIDIKTEYYPNGNICSKTRNVNGEFDGDQMIYYETGNIKLKRMFEMEKEIGVEYYDENGKRLKNKPTTKL